jgi:general nucleoside transport system permease protein
MTDVALGSIDTDPPESPARVHRRSPMNGEVLGLYGACIVGALVIAAVLVATTGGSWPKVFTAIIDGSLRKPGRIGLTIGVATPILMVAVGTIINSRAGLVNIGQEGQLVIGSAFAAYAGVRLGGPGPLALLLALAFGVVGGALWAAIAGVLRYWRNVPEVLSTLLLGTVADNLVGWGLRNRRLLLSTAADRANRNQVSEPLAANTRIPRVTWFGNELPPPPLSTITLAVVAAVVLSRTVVGFRLRMLGLNRNTAQRSGVDARRYGMAAITLSGAFAGLAGGMMLAGGDFGNYQLVDGFGTGIGFAGLLVALVAGNRVLVAIVVAFVFGCLRTGSSFLRSTGVSGRIADVVQGLLVLALLLPPAILYVRQRRRALAQSVERV